MQKSNKHKINNKIYDYDEFHKDVCHLEYVLRQTVSYQEIEQSIIDNNENACYIRRKMIHFAIDISRTNHVNNFIKKYANKEVQSECMHYYQNYR